MNLRKKILTRIFETGHPWITFKDPSNIRSPQQHCGIIHSSNLCTEILLNTSKEETAVCNIGSINLVAHLDNNNAFNLESLKDTIHTAIKMLDNIIDITFYPSKKAELTNQKHRPIGLGVMGWQDILFKKSLSFQDNETEILINTITEFISYHSILASSEIAKEKGSYASYEGSLWNQGIMPHETITKLQEQRNSIIEILPTKSGIVDWDIVKEHIRSFGMRNSLTMAIAPTATISTIAGVFPSIEPIYKNIYVKSNITGEFAIINKYLIHELESLNLWDNTMINLIKFYNGSIQSISSIPQRIKNIYKTAFEIDQKILLKLTAIRGCWIDQAQSHNIFFDSISGKLLNDIYTTAWKYGLKTTYYCRTLAKSGVEKATLSINEFGLTQLREDSTQKKKCDLTNEQECLSCQ